MPDTSKSPRRTCEYCHERKPAEQVSYGPDPYLSGLYGDITPHWICNDCYHERVMKI